MEIIEYERLVSSETQALRSKITMAIDAAMISIQREQSVLMDKIKFDPRKTAIRKKNIKLRLEISNEQGDDKNSNEKMFNIMTDHPRELLRQPGVLVRNILADLNKK